MPWSGIAAFLYLSPMRRIKWVAFCLAAFLVVMVAVVLMPVDKEYGYGQMVPVCDQNDWLFSRIFRDTTPIDIAFVGSSHTMLAVKDSLLSAHLTTRNGQRAVNLGFCEYGRSLHYVVIKDLLAHHQPRTIVLECRTGESLHSHRDFGRIAAGKDVLMPRSVWSGDYFGDLFTAFGSRTGGWMAGEQDLVTDQAYGYRYSNNLLDSLHLLKRAELERKRTSGRAAKGLKKRLLNRYPEAYVRAIANLASDNGVELYFLYLPSLPYWQEKPERTDLYNELGTLLLPPDSIFQPTSHWSDLNHLNRHGAGELTEWLSLEIN